jgi:hypothetical protein
LLRIGRWVVGSLIGAATLVFGFAQAVGPPWPTLPQVQPNETSSPDILPFHIRNESVVFNMLNAQLICNVCGASFLTEDRQHQLKLLPTNSQSECSLGYGKTPKVTIPANAPINYQCDSSAGIREPTLNNKPLMLEAFSVRISMDYGVNLWVAQWHRTFRSHIFTYVRRSNGNFWFEGDVVPY